ncbi:hypothetical protein [Acinetobacter soli]|uniref:Uncharacterized protein n=1 Tax=Acinetobacter soli TaxID=487316 RepID=A0AB38Z0B6_9GAMM|nr:hypothetical protein [Acinetobacter soli]WND06876.1 hypothetical protein RHP80_07020 [Acinetobacter soli]
MRRYIWLLGLCLCIIAALCIWLWFAAAPKPPAVPAKTPSKTIQVAPIQSQSTALQVPKPECSSSSTCARLDVQTLKTNDPWLKQWIDLQIAEVINEQLKKKITPPTLDAVLKQYLKQSKQWQAQYSRNRPYELKVSSAIAYQKNQYVLLQIGLNVKQEEITIKNRYYFMVADRKSKRMIAVNDILHPKQQAQFEQWVQTAYRKTYKKKHQNSSTGVRPICSLIRRALVCTIVPARFQNTPISLICILLHSKPRRY